MSEGKQIFFDLVAKVEQSGRFSQIIAQELPRYLVSPIKSQWLEIKIICNIYESIEIRQRSHQEPIADFQTWNDNEKKVFIWFVIFYTYFLELEGQTITQDSWPIFSKVFFGRNIRFLHFHYLNLLKPEGKVNWTPEEDALLADAVEKTEEGKWNEVSKHFFFASDFKMFKCSKHCRERWLNHLDEKKKHGNWTPQEDLVIFNFVLEVGKKWSKLVPVLNNTRTEHMIKNRFNSLMTKIRGGSKRDREETTVQKVIKHIKKQISNIERRKKKKECTLNEIRQEFIEQDAAKADAVYTVKLEEHDESPSCFKMESNEKVSLPSSNDETIKKEESEVKDFSMKESVESEQKGEEIFEPVQMTQMQPQAPMMYMEQPMQMPMEQIMYRPMGQWYAPPMMPYVVPYGYYPTHF